MAMNTSKCDHLMPLHFKGLTLLLPKAVNIVGKKTVDKVP